MSDEESNAQEANLDGQETSTFLAKKPSEEVDENSRLAEAMDADEAEHGTLPPSLQVSLGSDDNISGLPSPPSYEEAVTRSRDPVRRHRGSPQLNDTASSPSSPRYEDGRERRSRSGSVDDSLDGRQQPPQVPSRSSSIDVMNRLKEGNSRSGSIDPPVWLEDMQRVSQSSLDTAANRPSAEGRTVSPEEAVISLAAKPVQGDNGTDIELVAESDQPDAKAVPAVGFRGSVELRDIQETSRRGSYRFATSVENVERGGDAEKESWRDWLSERRAGVIIIMSILSLCLLLFLILFPISFVTVEYHEYALKRTRSTRVLERNETYYYGCYVIGPNSEFLKFPATAQTAQFDLTIYTMERLQVSFSVSLQYFLRGEEIGDLYLKFGPEYAHILELMVSAALKNRMIHFTVDEMRNDRANLEIILHQTAHRKLGGTCCLPCCATGSCQGRQLQLCVGCSRARDCDRGYHTNVLYFQLGDLTIPSVVQERILKQLVIQVEAETEYFTQDKKLTEITTEKMVQAKHNQANEASANATAWGNMLTVQANAEFEKVTQSAAAEGLLNASKRLDLDEESHVLSYYWITTLNKKELLQIDSIAFNKNNLFSRSKV